MIKVFLRKGKEASLERFHPWVFSGAVAKMTGEPEEGEVVEVYTASGEFIAIGHYQIGSIAVRVLSFEKRAIDKAFIVERLTAAYNMRKAMNLDFSERNNTFRLDSIQTNDMHLVSHLVDIIGYA